MILVKLLEYIVRKIKFSRYCRFRYSTKISLRSSFEGMNQIFSNTRFYGKMGLGSYIESGSEIWGIIGRFTSIGNNVKTIIGTHPYSAPFVTTCPSFFATNPHKFQNGSTFAEEDLFNQQVFLDNEKLIAVEIGSDCWIGANVSILGGGKNWGWSRCSNWCCCH